MLMNHFFYQILFLLCTCILSAEASEKQSPQPEKKYALYLTTGSEAHQFEDIDWGGYHVTLTGFHHKNGNEALLDKLPQIIEESSSFGGWKPRRIGLQKWGKHWAVVFHSRTLNKMVRKLFHEGFKKIKGPEFCKSAFHMTLPNMDQQTARVFANSLKEKKWFLTLVELNSSKRSFHKASWLQYFHL